MDIAEIATTHVIQYAAFPSHPFESPRRVLKLKESDRANASGKTFFVFERFR